MALLQAWQYLQQDRWSAAHGRGLQLAAKQMVRACERLRLSLTRKAGELETFVRAFVETALTPNPDQLRTLSALVSTLASTALALEVLGAATPVTAAAPAEVALPAVPSAKAAIQAARLFDGQLLGILGSDEELGAELAQVLAEQGYRAQRYRGLDDAKRSIAEVVPRALVIAASFANAVPSLRLLLTAKGDLGERHKDPRIAVVAPRKDLGRRLVALRQGVEYFEAPIDPLAVIANLTAEQQAHARGTRVLVVDQEREHGLESAGWLKDAGYIVRLCLSAPEAIEALGEFKPQIAVIDADMRGAESMRLLYGIRDNPNTADLPIVLIASSKELAVREQAIAGGADEYLLKPIKPRHLLSVIDSRIKRARRFVPRRASGRDDSSGLYSRREFIERAEAAHGQSNVAVLYLALDEAESLRKHLGMSGLNRLDSVIGQTLRESLRPEDLPASYQDSRYLVLLRRAQRVDAMATAETIREALARRQIRAGDREISLRASLGLASFDVDTADRAVQNAEAAAFAAQHVGGNRTMWYESRTASLLPAERDAQVRAIVLGPSLRDDLLRRGRPWIPLRGRIGGQFMMEPAWRVGGDEHASVGLGDLWPAARQAGHLLQLDRLLVGDTLALRAEQLQRGRQLRLIVDLSEAPLRDGSFAAWVENELRAKRLSGTGLGLVFPASVLGDGLESFISLVHALKPLGVRMGLRDLGRDMALVPRIKGTGCDFYKLSPELSTAAAAGERASELMVSMARRAHETGATIVACGVDAREQLEVLQAQGVDYAESDLIGPAGTDFQFDFSAYTQRPG